MVISNQWLATIFILCFWACDPAAPEGSIKAEVQIDSVVPAGELTGVETIVHNESRSAFYVPGNYCESISFRIERSSGEEVYPRQSDRVCANFGPHPRRTIPPGDSAYIHHLWGVATDPVDGAPLAPGIYFAIPDVTIDQGVVTATDTVKFRVVDQ